MEAVLIEKGIKYGVVLIIALWILILIVYFFTRNSKL